MLRRLMDILACPVCGEALHLHVLEEHRRVGPETELPRCEHRCALLSLTLDSAESRQEAYAHCPSCYGQDVSEGSLDCPSGHAFGIRRSIPRFLSGTSSLDRTKLTFDTEWTDYTYGRKIYGHSAEEELQDLFRRTGLDENLLRGGRILDAGCGMGRLCHVLRDRAKEIVGIDLSDGLEQAQALNREHRNVHIVQGDILHLPFGKGTFDGIYAKGVLQYVPDVPGCVSSLASAVRAGGWVSITLYPALPRLFDLFSRWVRRLSVMLPVRFNFRLSHLLIPFLPAVWIFSGMDRRPIDWNERAHMIFNWLSSPHQNSATEAEVRDWFVQRGFHRIRSGTIPVGVTGEKAP